MRCIKAWLCLQMAHLLLSAAAVPQFKVDLDLPPEERFVEIAKHYKEEMRAMHKRFQVVIDGYMNKTEQKAWHDVLDKTISDEHTAEALGVAKVLGYDKGTPEWYNFRLQEVQYELGSPSVYAAGPQCTGLLMAQPDGTVLHGRNMDFTFKFKMPNGEVKNLHDLTCEVIWHKNGKAIFQTTQFAADSFINTGMRYDGWTYETNSRCLGKDSMRMNLHAAQNGGLISSQYIRKMMEETPDYKTAKQKLWTAKLIAPVYMIMSGVGPYEGTVMTIDALAGHLVTTPHPVELSKTTPTGWYLVQTNDDDDTRPSSKGDWKKEVDVRFPLAQAMLAGVTQKAVSKHAVENFMHTPFVFNTDTVFSTVMNVKERSFKTILPTDAPHIQDAVSATESLAEASDDSNMSKKNNEIRAQIFAAVTKLVAEDPGGGGGYFSALKNPTPEFLKGVRTIAYLGRMLSLGLAKDIGVSDLKMESPTKEELGEEESGKDESGKSGSWTPTVFVAIALVLVAFSH